MPLSSMQIKHHDHASRSPTSTCTSVCPCSVMAISALFLRVFTARPGQAAAGFGSTKKSSSPSSVLDDLPTGSVQFSCLALDSGGELLVAGGQGSCFSVFVWSVQTGKLVDELTGHEAPVAAVRFHPHHSRQGVVVTGSWDRKVKVREQTQQREGRPMEARCVSPSPSCDLIHREKERG